MQDVELAARDFARQSCGVQCGVYNGTTGATGPRDEPTGGLTFGMRKNGDIMTGLDHSASQHVNNAFDPAIEAWWHRYLGVNGESDAHENIRFRPEMRRVA